MYNSYVHKCLVPEDFNIKDLIKLPESMSAAIFSRQNLTSDCILLCIKIL